MVRSTIVEYFVREFAAQGIPAERVLSRTGIDVQRLTGRDYTVSYDQICQLVRNAIRLSGTRTLSFAVGRSTKIDNFGVFGTALRSCATLLDVVYMAGHFDALFGNVVTYRAEVCPNATVRVHYEPLLALGDTLEFFIEQSISGTLTLARELTGVPIKFREVQLAYPRPRSEARRAEYRAALNCPVSFGRPHHVVVASLDAFMTPVASANSESFDVFSQYFEQQQSAINRGNVTRDQIARALIGDAGSHRPMGQVARQLGTSERTLRRRLAEAGESYVDIAGQCRLQLSLKYLGSTALKHKQIAHMVGYRDVSAFRRAFKKWTGVSITQYQRRNARGGR